MGNSWAGVLPSTTNTFSLRVVATSDSDSNKGGWDNGRGSATKAAWGRKKQRLSCHFGHPTLEYIWIATWGARRRVMAKGVWPGGKRHNSAVEKHAWV